MIQNQNNHLGDDTICSRGSRAHIHRGIVSTYSRMGRTILLRLVCGLDFILIIKIPLHKIYKLSPWSC